MAERKPKRGPIPGDHEKRTKLCGHYLTPTDWEALKKAAEKGGFKSTGALTTAVLEPIIHGGFSYRAAVTAINRIQSFMQSNGAKFGATWPEAAQQMMVLFRPPPPIVPDDLEDLSQLEKDLEALLAEVKTQNQQQTKIEK